MNRLAIIDGYGVYGNYLHYGLVVSFVGSALMIFVYLWSKGRLDMDESPKYHLLHEEEKFKPESEHGNAKE